MAYILILSEAFQTKVVGSIIHRRATSGLMGAARACKSPSAHANLQRGEIQFLSFIYRFFQERFQYREPSTEHYSQTPAVCSRTRRNEGAYAAGGAPGTGHDGGPGR